MNRPVEKVGLLHTQEYSLREKFDAITTDTGVDPQATEISPNPISLINDLIAETTPDIASLIDELST